MNARMLLPLLCLWRAIWYNRGNMGIQLASDQEKNDAAATRGKRLDKRHQAAVKNP